MISSYCRLTQLEASAIGKKSLLWISCDLSTSPALNNAHYRNTLNCLIFLQQHSLTLQRSIYGSTFNVKNRWIADWILQQFDATRRALSTHWKCHVEQHVAVTLSPQLLNSSFLPQTFSTACCLDHYALCMD